VFRIKQIHSRSPLKILHEILSQTTDIPRGQVNLSAIENKPKRSPIPNFCMADQMTQRKRVIKMPARDTASKTNNTTRKFLKLILQMSTLISSKLKAGISKLLERKRDKFDKTCTEAATVVRMVLCSDIAK